MLSSLQETLTINLRTSFCIKPESTTNCQPQRVNGISILSHIQLQFTLDSDTLKCLESNLVKFDFFRRKVRIFWLSYQSTYLRCRHLVWNVTKFELARQSNFRFRGSPHSLTVDSDGGPVGYRTSVCLDLWELRCSRAFNNWSQGRGRGWGKRERDGGGGGGGGGEGGGGGGGGGREGNTSTTWLNPQCPSVKKPIFIIYKLTYKELFKKLFCTFFGRRETRTDSRTANYWNSLYVRYL